MSSGFSLLFSNHINLDALFRNGQLNMESLTNNDVVAIKQAHSFYKTIYILGSILGVICVKLIKVFQTDETVGSLLFFCMFMGHLAVSLQYKKVTDQLPYREELGNLAEKPKSSVFWMFLLIPFSMFYFAYNLERRVSKFVFPDGEPNVRNTTKLIDEAISNHSVLSKDTSEFVSGYGIETSQAYNYVPLIKVYKQLSVLFCSLVGVLILGSITATAPASTQNIVMTAQMILGLVWAVFLIVVGVQYFARSWSNATQLAEHNADIGTKLKNLVYWHIFGITLCVSIVFGLLDFVFRFAAPDTKIPTTVGWILYALLVIACDVFVDWRRDLLLGGVFPSNVTKWRWIMQASFVLLIVVSAILVA